MSESYYDRLGVQPDASTEAIKTAYRQLARRLHPDIDPGPAAAAQFKLVSEAYATLSDGRKRLSYNQSLLARVSTENRRPGLSRGELRAAWERVFAYFITGALIGGGLVGSAQWLGNDQPWNVAALLLPLGIGGLLGIIWGIDANFVVGDFVGSAGLWSARIVRFIAWIGGLSWLTHQALVAVQLGSGPLATELARFALIGAMVLGTTISLVATLRDH